MITKKLLPVIALLLVSVHAQDYPSKRARIEETIQRRPVEVARNLYRRANNAQLGGRYWPARRLFQEFRSMDEARELPLEWAYATYQLASMNYLAEGGTRNFAAARQLFQEFIQNQTAQRYFVEEVALSHYYLANIARQENNILLARRFYQMFITQLVSSGSEQAFPDELRNAQQILASLDTVTTLNLAAPAA